jgi:hypothetical protein
VLSLVDMEIASFCGWSLRANSLYPFDLLLQVYCVGGESTPVESPVVITCLWSSDRSLSRGIPVELLGWCFHGKGIELEAQVLGGMWGNEQNKSDGVLNQVMLKGIAGGCTTRGDVELAINRRQVPVDGARTDDELFRHLGVGQSLCRQA